MGFYERYTDWLSTEQLNAVGLASIVVCAVIAALTVLVPMRDDKGRARPVSLLFLLLLLASTLLAVVSLVRGQSREAKVRAEQLVLHDEQLNRMDGVSQQLGALLVRTEANLDASREALERQQVLSWETARLMLPASPLGVHLRLSIPVKAIDFREAIQEFERGRYFTKEQLPRDVPEQSEAYRTLTNLKIWFRLYYGDAAGEFADGVRYVARLGDVMVGRGEYVDWHPHLSGGATAGVVVHLKEEHLDERFFHPCSLLDLNEAVCRLYVSAVSQPDEDGRQYQEGVDLNDDVYMLLDTYRSARFSEFRTGNTDVYRDYLRMRMGDVSKARSFTEKSSFEYNFYGVIGWRELGVLDVVAKINPRQDDTLSKGAALRPLLLAR